MKQTSNGKANAKTRARTGTPTFAVHQPDYDPKAADAKKTSNTSAR